jgi:hypothetical protein
LNEHPSKSREIQHEEINVTYLERDPRLYLMIWDTLVNQGALICYDGISINTNGNIERIFPSVNFWGILTTEIFP